MAERVTEDKCLADVGCPTKVLVPPGTKRRTYENRFSNNLHIASMVAINAADDYITPNLILPLKYLPRNIAPIASKNQINVGCGENGYIYDENFDKW